MHLSRSIEVKLLLTMQALEYPTSRTGEICDAHFARSVVHRIPQGLALRIWRRTRLGTSHHRRTTPVVSEEEFTNILSLCRFMPGPNIVGIAICVGAKLRGSIGAIAAATGFVLIPLMICFPLGVLCLQHAHLAAFQNVLSGVSAVAAGLLIALVLTAGFVDDVSRAITSRAISAGAWSGMAKT